MLADKHCWGGKGGPHPHRKVLTLRPPRAAHPSTVPQSSEPPRLSGVSETNTPTLIRGRYLSPACLPLPWLPIIQWGSKASTLWFLKLIPPLQSHSLQPHCLTFYSRTSLIILCPLPGTPQPLLLRHIGIISTSHSYFQKGKVSPREIQEPKQGHTVSQDQGPGTLSLSPHPGAEELLSGDLRDAGATPLLQVSRLGQPCTEKCGFSGHSGRGR